VNTLLPPQVDEFWPALKARLDTAEMRKWTRGAGRVYIEGDDYSKPEAGEYEPWGRVVIVPVVRAYAVTWGYSMVEPMPFLVRPEMHPPNARYDARLPLGRMLQEAWRHLFGWAPEGHTRATHALPISLERRAQSAPAWDQPRGVWWMSDEYRAYVAPKA
jgi:hypothetical protein